jgi:hypothetical protein
MVIAASIVAGLALGWVGGMWTRKRSNLWCPVDGTTLSCPRCLPAGARLRPGPADGARRASTVEGRA